MKSILLIAMVGLAIPGTAPQSNSGVIEGTVIRLDTSEPLAGVQVVLAEDRNRVVITDSGGRFVLEGIAPGAHVIRAGLEGYGPRRPDVNVFDSRSVTVSPRQRVQSIVFGLVPWGTISGVVLGSNGQPLVRTTVTAGQVVYQDGRRTARFSPALAQGQTNDRGEYRLFYLGPGDYFVQADPPGSGVRGAAGRGIARGLVDAPPQPSDTYFQTYFPGTIDFDGAESVRLREGDTAIANFALKTARTVTVSGRLVYPSPTDGVWSVGSLNLVPKGGAPEVATLTVPNSTTESSDRSSSPFEIRGVPPGSYILFPQIRTPRVAERITMGIPIEVGVINIQGLKLLARSPVDVRGHVTRSEAAVVHPVNPVTLQLRSVGGMPNSSAQIAADDKGTFTIPQMSEGQYHLDTPRLPPGSYVSDIRQSGKSVFSDGIIAVGANSADAVELILSSNGGTVRGTVRNIAQNWQGTIVVLVPETSRRKNSAAYKTALVDSQGQFALNDIAPGEYRLFAWENIPARAYQNSEFLSKYEERGVSIRVTAGASLNIPLDLIPSGR